MRLTVDDVHAPREPHRAKGAAGAGGEEVPKAFVVLQPGAEMSEWEVMDFVAANVAPHKKVRVVE